MDAVGHAYQTLQEAQVCAHRQQYSLSVLTDGMAYLDQAIARRVSLLARNKKGRPINRRKKDEFLPDIFILLALKFIALTGLRHREPLRLKWEHIFERQGIIRIEEAKNDFQTKDITPEITELLKLAREAAKALGRDESEWVFPSRKTDSIVNGRFHYGPTVNLEKSWLIIREQLGLGETHIIPTRKNKKVPVRIHDLRHTFGTMAYQAIKNVDDVQRLMNHDQRASTNIYIHLLEEQRKKDALTVGAAMKEKTQKAPA
jgi:integrase